MVYARILILFGLVPLLALWLVSRRWIGRYVGIMVWLPLMVVAVGASWEATAVDWIWFYGPHTVLGPRVLGIPIEEWLYYVLDALLVATISLVVARLLPQRDERLYMLPGGRA